MKCDPFASVEEMVRLPERHKLTDKEKIFSHIVGEEGDEQNGLTEPLKNKANKLLDELNGTFEVYNGPKSFKFAFPESMFPDINQNERNEIRYEQKIITEQEDTFKSRLSEEQLKEIKQNGELKVASNVEYVTLPYVWQINTTIFFGEKKNQLYWRKVLATIYGLFYTAKNFVITEIPQQLSNIASIPSQLFKLLFGKKSLETIVSVQYQRQIFKDFWDRIMKEYYHESEEWFSALWNYLYVQYNVELTRPIEYAQSSAQNDKLDKQRSKLSQKDQAAKNVVQNKMQVIESAEQKFDKQWAKMRKMAVLEITDEINALEVEKGNPPGSDQDLLLNENNEKDEIQNDKKILQKLADKKFTLYIEHLEQTLPQNDVPQNVINAIILILRLFSVISARNQKLIHLRQQKQQQIQNRIKSQHPIKSMHLHYLNGIRNKQCDIANKYIDDDMYLSLLRDKELTSFLSENQMEAFKEFLKFRANKTVFIQAKKLQIPEYHGPTRTFYSNYRLLPPYKVIKTNNNYSLKTVSDDLTVDTSTNFWKLRLYWMRAKTWSINCLVFLAFSVWKGPVGLRCLWGIQDFPVGMNIDPRTGEISRDTTKTVLGSFNQVLEGVRKSRQTFERAPDLGLLGKNVSRIFNYAECYIFRFLLVGIILVLVGFPILIIVASVVTFIIVLTVWAWIPLVLLATYFFNIFIKQFQIARLPSYESLPIFFPLLRIPLKLIFGFVMIVVAVLSLTVLAPVSSFFIFIFCGGVTIFRRCIDKLLMIVFRYLGRTPSRNSMIAKKISGPGMSKQFYMSINEDDVYILIRANLQVKLLSKFNQLLIAKIEKQGCYFQNVIGKILQPFGAHYNQTNRILENKNQLMQNYSKQYQINYRRYPQNPRNVRFTQEEIDNYFPNTVSIVKSFVEKYEIQGWIFEDCQLYEGMYDQLTRSVWMEIFASEEIFEPLEKLDCRFKLEDQYKDDVTLNNKMRKGVGSVMKALEGQVSFNHHNKRLSPFKHNLLSREKPVESVSEVFAYWRLNSLQSVNLNTNSLKSLFIPNLSIKEIRIVDDETRMRTIKQQIHIVDI